MRTTLSMLTLGVLVASTHSASADQCAKNPQSIADKAAALVKKGATVIEYCEPCRDAAPGKPYTVQSVAVKDGELVINGAMVDLAYLFLEGAPGEFKNVGVMTDCGASGVSASIRGGKPSGPIKSSPSTPGKPRPPLPPPPPRPSSAAELAGDWNVRLTTRYSSCSSMAPAAYSEWTITFDAGALGLKSNDGSELAGAVDSKSTGGWFKATLKPKQRPSGGALQLTMFMKDRINGTLLRTQKGSDPKDPICVIHQDISASRK